MRSKAYNKPSGQLDRPQPSTTEAALYEIEASGWKRPAQIANVLCDDFGAATNP
jgi:hypothetical protein